MLIALLSFIQVYRRTPSPHFFVQMLNKHVMGMQVATFHRWKFLKIFLITIKRNHQLVPLQTFVCLLFNVHSRIFCSCVDVTIADLGLCLAGGILIVPHLLSHGASVFAVSSEGPCLFSRLLRQAS